MVDATGKWVLPAGIDLHTELSAGQAAEELQGSTRAARQGGTGTVLDVVIPGLGETLLGAVERVRKLVDARALCNVALSVSLNKWDDSVRAEVEQLAKLKLANSFILEMQSDSEVFEALECLRSLGMLARLYPENKDVVALLEKQLRNLSPEDAYLKARPIQVGAASTVHRVQLEAERVHRISVLSQLTGAPVSVLCTSSAEVCGAVSAGRREGAPLYAEVAVATLAGQLPAAQGRVPVRAGAEHAQAALRLLAK